MKKTSILFLFAFCMIICLNTSHSYAQEKSELRNKVDEYISDNRLDDAIGYLDGYLKENSRSVEGNRLMAKAWFEKGSINDRKKTKKYLEKALKISTKDIPTLLDLADYNIFIERSYAAEHYLNRVLKLDKSNLDACIKLMSIYSKRNDKKNIKRMTTRIVEIGEIDDSMLITMGTGYYKTGELNKSVLVLKKIEKGSPFYSKANYYLGKMYQGLNKKIKASQCFFNRLSSMTDEKMLKTTYLTMAGILSDSQRDSYKGLPIEKKGKYLAGYWLKKDPDIFTDENERLLEHYRRVEYSQKYFSKPFAEGYDDRGKYYVRWGAPDFRYMDFGGRQIKTENTYIYVKSNETWSYPSINNRIVLDFVEFGDRFRYAGSLRDAIVLRDNKSQADNLYDERTGHLWGKYKDTFYIRMGAERPWERENALINAPGERYELESILDPFKMDVKTAQFKGEPGKTDLIFLYALTEKTMPKCSNGLYRFKQQVIARDKNWKRKYYNEKMENLDTICNPGEILPYYYDTGLLKLEAGTFHTGIGLTDSTIGVRAVHTAEINVRDFSGNGLMCSDIIFAHDIKPDNNSGKFVRNRTKITPFPFKKISKINPVNIYFEIYNLALDNNGYTRYELSSTLKRTGTKGNIISRIINHVKDRHHQPVTAQFERKSTRMNEQEYFSILFSALDKGRYELTVQVKDLIGGKTTSVQKAFELTN